MVSCEELYTVWKKKGNFCHKSEGTARQIELYMEYRDKYDLESYEINRSALFPLMQIEHQAGASTVHTLALKELKKNCRRIGGRRITRRLMIEIISRVNDKVDIAHKITHIPMVRSRVVGYQHELSELSFEVREGFDKLKQDTEINSNNNLMLAMIRYASEHQDDILKMKELIEIEKAQEAEETKDDIVQDVKNDIIVNTSEVKIVSRT